MRFTYDVNGLLQVEATILRTGSRAELVLQRGDQTLDKREIAPRLATLAALKAHPRENQANVAFMARAERIDAEYLDHRETVSELLARFAQMLESQDSERIDRLRTEFESLLDRMER